jgi:hypothetical protein
MVVLPTVEVMVLPSVVMVETISEVVIGTAYSGQYLARNKDLNRKLTPPAAPDPEPDAVPAVFETVPEAVTAEVAAPGLEKVPEARKEYVREISWDKPRPRNLQAAGAPQYWTAYWLMPDRSVPAGHD